MKKISLLLAFLLMLSTQAIFAQSETIKGLVTDENNEPLPFVTVVIKGTTNGSTTSIDGSFQLDAQPNDVLVFSFVGYKTLEVPINGRKKVDVNLLPDSKMLEEVMVVAYGTTTKKSFTGSASTVKADVLERLPVSSFDKALQGNASGVQVNDNSGQPGAATSIRIRGIGTLNASAEPLYVIDGVAINNSDISGVANSEYGTSTNPLSAINPADIESVNILKDASAASLYGSRAANGVVIITTKKGKKGKKGSGARINAKAQWGVSDLAVKPYDVMSADEYYKKEWEGLYNYALAGGDSNADAASFAHNNVAGVVGFNPFQTPEGETPILDNGTINPNAKLMVNNDWRDEIFRTGKTQQYDVNVSGGNDKVNYYVSGGYLKQDGVIKNSNFERFSTAINVEGQAKEWLKIGMKNNLSYSDQNTPPAGSGADNVVASTSQIPMAIPIYVLDPVTFRPILANGEKQFNYDNNVYNDFNPIGINEIDIFNTKTVRVLSSAFAEAVVSDFKFKSILAVDAAGLNETRYYNTQHGNGASVNGRSSKYRTSELTISSTNTINWSKQLNEANKLDVLVGQEAVKSTLDFLQAQKTNFPFDGVDQLVAGSTPTEAYQYTSTSRLFSLFSRVNYDYNSRLYGSASLRYDGSSRFGDDYKYGTFFSLGGGWRISQESWMPEWSWLDDMKIRASVGASGNDGIGNFEHLGYFAYNNNYAGNPGIQLSNLSNPELSWEKNTNINVGLDISIFNSVTATVEYFNRFSDGLLYDKRLSLTSGLPTKKLNLASIVSSGVELQIHSTNIATDDFVWTTNFNLTYNQNELTDLGDYDRYINGTKIWEKGRSPYEYFIREWAGVNRENGRPMWYLNEHMNTNRFTANELNSLEASGDIYKHNGRYVTSTYSLAEKDYQGDALPKIYGGLGNSFSYKGFELDFLVYFSLGGQILDVNRASLSHSGESPGTNMLRDQNDSWTPENRDSENPIYIYGNTDNPNTTSTRFLKDASYVRLKHVTFGYNLPRNLVSKIGINNAKVFAQVNNILTLSQLEGVDPAQAALSGNTQFSIPTTKSFNVGINIGL
ncbi:MAG: SusC/RagA family TonB-linked outer membrane protein [Hyphomicrobiales bacterium]